MKKVNKMARKRYNSKPLPKTEKGKIHIVNMSSYTRPEIVEQYNRDWVEYGEDNDYFNYLIDRYNGSATNNAAINGIAEMIYGKGLDAVEEDAKGKDYDEMKELFTKILYEKSML